MRIIRPPKLKKGFNQHILPTFNEKRYLIPHVQTLFDIDRGTVDHTGTLLKIKYVLSPKQKDFIVNNNIHIFDQDYPVSVPLEVEQPIFGHLFGIDFNTTVKNEKDPTLHIRQISMFKYISIYGYNNEFTYRISQRQKNLRFMNSTITLETQHKIISSLLLMLEEHQKPRIHAQTI